MTVRDPEQRERLAYVTLVSLFLGLLGVFVSREQKERGSSTRSRVTSS